MHSPLRGKVVKKRKLDKRGEKKPALRGKRGLRLEHNVKRGDRNRLVLKQRGATRQGGASLYRGGNSGLGASQTKIGTEKESQKTMVKGEGGKVLFFPGLEGRWLRGSYYKRKRGNQFRETVFQKNVFKGKDGGKNAGSEGYSREIKALASLWRAD